MQSNLTDLVPVLYSLAPLGNALCPLNTHVHGVRSIQVPIQVRSHGYEQSNAC